MKTPVLEFIFNKVSGLYLTVTYQYLVNAYIVKATFNLVMNNT